MLKIISGMVAAGKPVAAICTVPSLDQTIDNSSCVHETELASPPVGVEVSTRATHPNRTFLSQLLLLCCTVFARGLPPFSRSATSPH
jgi:hypothetical protein